MSEEEFKQKYLKYKNKYIQLKKLEEEMGKTQEPQNIKPELDLDGGAKYNNQLTYYIFAPDKTIDVIKNYYFKELNGGGKARNEYSKIPIDKIEKYLDRRAYIVSHNSRQKPSLITTSDSQINKTVIDFHTIKPQIHNLLNEKSELDADAEVYNGLIESINKLKYKINDPKSSKNNLLEAIDKEKTLNSNNINNFENNLKAKLPITLQIEYDIYKPETQQSVIDKINELFTNVSGQAPMYNYSSLEITIDGDSSNQGLHIISNSDDLQDVDPIEKDKWDKGGKSSGKFPSWWPF